MIRTAQVVLVRTSPSSGCTGSVPESGPEIPHAQGLKTQTVETEAIL